MKILHHLKEFYLKYIVLIFVFISLFPASAFLNEVKADPFDGWQFELQTTAGSNTTSDGTVTQFQMKIKDKNNKLGSGTSKGAVWNEVIQRYKILILAILGIATLTLLLVAMLLFTKLAATASNPQERANVFKWIGAFLVSAGLLGSLSMVFAYSYGLFGKH